MSDKLKGGLIAVIVALIGLGYIIIEELGGQSPPPVVEEPVPDEPGILSASTGALLYPDAAIILRPRMKLHGARGEVLGLHVHSDHHSCLNIGEWQSGPLSLEVFRIHPAPSAGVPTLPDFPQEGYLDPLEPMGYQLCPGDNWLDISIARDAQPGAYAFGSDGLNVEVTVWNLEMPEEPSIPFYAEIEPRKVAFAHWGTDNVNVSLQGPAVRRYADLYRAHRVEPMKQWLQKYPPTDLDMWGNAGSSFRQLVLEDRIAPPILFGPRDVQDDTEGAHPPTAALENIEAKIQSGELPPDSIGYIWDEGERDATARGRATDRLEKVRRVSPSLLTLITWTPETADPELVDLPVGVAEWFDSGWADPFGVYFSCMAQGCGIHSATGTPIWPYDAPPVNRRAMGGLLAFSGAGLGLYYNFTEHLTTAWEDQSGFGGRGDGDGVYPGNPRVDGVPWPSLRLKHLRRGLQDAEYIVAAQAVGILGNEIEEVYPSYRQWVGDWDAMESLKVLIGDALTQ